MPKGIGAPKGSPRPAPASNGRTAYAGSQFNDPAWAPDPAKRRQARIATKAGPPPGFAPVETPPAPPGTGQKVTDRLPAKPVTQNVDGSAATKSGPGVFDRLGSGDAGGLIFGVFGLVLFVQYLHGDRPGGPGGSVAVKAWLAAKFMNRVPDKPKSGGGTPDPTFGGKPIPHLTPTPPLYPQPNTLPPTAVPVPNPQAGPAPTPGGK